LPPGMWRDVRNLECTKTKLHAELPARVAATETGSSPRKALEDQIR
jgi:hypothetical protein